MRYAKPHLTYNEQLKLLVGRGLKYGNQGSAINALRSIGYYRLSAYTYPLREKGAPNADGTRGPRSDNFVPGATFEQVLALHDFDATLRTCLLDGLQRVEIGMRVQVGHRLGLTDPFGHLDRAHLDAAACAEVSRPDSSQDDHSVWLDWFDKLCADGKNEEFVKHFLTRYDGEMPIWVATELMTFGCLTMLYSLLSQSDAAAIGRNLEIRDRTILHKYMKSMNVLRNHCAHNARIWNRSTVYPPPKPPANLTADQLHHLRSADANKLYFVAALTGHFLTRIDAATKWPSRFKAVIETFPSVNGMTPENQMGFVPGWRDEAIWNFTPKGT